MGSIVPFGHHGNVSFTLSSVGKNAPRASGVYGLSNARQWIYVGETADIQTALLGHLHNPHAFLREYRPSGFTFELRATGERIERQNQLVRELAPVGNRLAGQLTNLDVTRKGAQ